MYNISKLGENQGFGSSSSLLWGDRFLGENFEVQRSSWTWKSHDWTRTQPWDIFFLIHHLCFSTSDGCLDQGVQPWHYWHLRPDHSFLRQAVLCIEGCLAASLTSTNEVSVALLSVVVTTIKGLQTLPSVPWWRVGVTRRRPKIRRIETNSRSWARTALKQESPGHPFRAKEKRVFQLPGCGK